MSRTVKHWIVKTGTSTRTATGKDAFAAAVAAVKTGAFKTIGFLIEVVPADEEPTDTNTIFIDSMKVVEKAGMLQA